MKMPTLTQAKLARKLLRQNVPMAQVIIHLGDVYDEAMIKAGIDRMREHNRSRSSRDTGFVWKGMETIRTAVPPEVIADRNRRANLVHIDTTAMRMGDPLPGYSALERAPSIAPDFIRDPLDTLIFRRRKFGKAAVRYG